MERKFPRLFEPIQIGKVGVKNRIAMAPMGFPILQDFDGIPTQRYVDYFNERAKGRSRPAHHGHAEGRRSFRNYTPAAGRSRKNLSVRLLT